MANKVYGRREFRNLRPAPKATLDTPLKKFWAVVSRLLPAF